MTDEKRQGTRVPIGLRVRLRFTNIDEFIAGYASNISRSGVFLEGVAPRPVDTLVRFELQLGDGKVALRGEGTVIWARGEGAHVGVAVRFTKLDSKSKTLIDELLARSPAGRASVPPPPPPSLSQPAVRISRPSSAPLAAAALPFRESQTNRVMDVAIKGVPARASRPSIESLELELQTLARESRVDAARVSQPSRLQRRSIDDLAADLDRLSDELSIPTKSHPAPKPVRAPDDHGEVPSASATGVASVSAGSNVIANATANVTASPSVAASAPESGKRLRPGMSVPPVPSDYADLPPVFSLMGDDGEIRSALNPPEPQVEAAAQDADAELDGAAGKTVPPESMREPTPVPEPGDEEDGYPLSLAVIPQAPAMPRADVAASMHVHDELPDLDLGDMAEPPSHHSELPPAALGEAAEELDSEFLEADLIEDDAEDPDGSSGDAQDPSRKPVSN